MMMRRPLSLAVAAVLACLSPACVKMAANMTGGVIQEASASFMSEEDYDLAAAAVAANLKTLEGLLRIVPENKTLLTAAAQSFGAYAYGFIEDELADTKDEARREKLSRRAIRLYQRAREYGLQLMRLESGFAEAWKAGREKLRSFLAELGRDFTPGLLWTAFAIVGAANLGQENPALLVDLPKAVMMAERVVAVQPAFNYGLAHLLLGGYHAALPEQFGGKPEKAKAHFEKALELAQGKFLMTKVTYAELFLKKASDKPARDKLLQEVLAASLDILPEERLTNVIAQRRAQRLLKGGEDGEE